uniref:Ferredoxin-fold anticodon binding domain containing 1 n=1 Tax=Nothobranchius furzeri TaxID=105023 RepID=A0A8C6P8J8_NOTFU
MDVPPARSILLVGEGNFSFSSSVCQLEAESSITATCLQHQEEALRQEGAAINIQTIQDSGGCVLFGVDCTKLGECVSLQGRVFDRVVFNFPHCGRKSGVKKNRELLKNFFLSCIQVLAEDGEVHVSLCNGQGGTPVDKPKREWHNSWQVAAMAAEAHLILSAVCPFENENYPSYKCTGYRSQDKGFRVENALLHIFSRSFPCISVQITHMEEVVEGENVHYNIPTELSDYVFRCGNTAALLLSSFKYKTLTVSSLSSGDFSVQILSIQQFSHGPPPGTPFCPFSLHPEPFSFDISFWTGPSWEEKKFYAAIREASLGTVEQVQLMDTFSHPDLSQTSYCYRLTYHSHTHALSHTQALMFHKHLELLLSSRLQVTIR